MIRGGLLAALLLGAPALAQDAPWPVDLYDPGAAEAPADLVLPMPCGGAMAFQRVVVPVAPDDPMDDRRLRLGQSDAATGYSDYLRTEHLRGAFGAEEGSAYFIARYELTRAQAAALAGDCTPPSRQGRIAQGGLSWFDAVDLARRYSEWLLVEARAALPPEAEGAAFLRLPTEAEWEYAVRGGAVAGPADFAARRFSGESPVEDVAMIQGSARGNLLPVGLRGPNPLGLYDVYGNAEELMFEPFRLNALGRNHGQAGGLVTRGGSVLSTADQVYSAQRSEYPFFRTDDGRALAGETFGMRLVLARHVATSDAALSDLRAAWLRRAEAPATEAGDPGAVLAAMIEEEDDPGRKAALASLEHEFRLSRERAAAALADTAKSTLLSGAVVIGALADGQRDMARRRDNVVALVDQIRVSGGSQQQALMQAAERLNAELDDLRRLQRSYLLSLRSALETLSSEIEPAIVERAFRLMEEELALAGQQDLLAGLRALARDREIFAERPDMGDPDLLRLALDP